LKASSSVLKMDHELQDDPSGKIRFVADAS